MAAPEVAIASVVTASAATVVPSLFGFDSYIIAFIGVPFTVVGMAAAGSLMSFAFGSPEPKRLKLLFTAGAATLIGAAAVTGIPALLHINQIAEPAQPVAGFFYALFTRWAMPVFIDVLPMLIRRWLNIPEKKPGDTP